MRKRWIQINGELYQVEDDYIAPRREVGSDTILWNDRAYQDGGDPRFHSRAQHRAYMRERGLTTIDDYRGEWKRTERARIEARAGVDPARKAHIAEAIRKLTKG